MAENSSISWTTHTWNPVIGCTKVSPACDGCYAEAMMAKRYHRVEWGAPGQGVGTRVRTSKSTWDAPLKWQRQAEKDGTRPFVFCASLADVFDNQWEADWRGEAFAVMRKTPNLVYLLLTKRPQMIVKLSDAAGGLPANAALGTTVEDQQRADINLPALQVAKIELKPLFTFGSFEPLLGPVVIPVTFMPDWVIVGGETDQGGHQARPTHPDWFRDLRDQAAEAKVPFHLKQWGEWIPGENVPSSVRGRRPSAHYFNDEWDIGSTNMSDPEDGWMDEPDVYRIGKKLTSRMLDGVTHDAFPEVANV
ncbi:phage Gp37/Gp68 family protein [Rhizobium sp. VS19-DR104.2]|uniref:phage Gp37/Gp68 family protein n=1 Tax=unclassified Rhizobium TaxID=2613769 RepID=UPI001CC5A4F2|nr:MULTISPECIES: phage Gp37/Gp68 family protein [unclassified Rhizobium]MBZ5761534.1 phage Gp37/Gp68 family protein [Rhizobium sp. VS19-DR96]MBZ5767482.1 phage Gp37/Gp68 family protein [Rhizobium sp. VS19-DR129.2]MBZ5775069.1 phage Gp37/Gp68 family protein [Rhizobium sp. VS19-DRK62.2]MBZ5785966.1 phage Gp37/Gp68 family protein [Rhizobium sp. VS19-DR121]MBZ5803392.1 phage Gp37/Gp68 family protein [Rhizobium sp. VS19-DR181]